MTPSSPKKYIEIVEIATGSTVHKIDVTGSSSRAIEKTAMGVMRKTDLEKFIVKEPS